MENKLAQLIVKIDRDKYKKLKEYCLANDITITDLIKQYVDVVIEEKSSKE